MSELDAMIEAETMRLRRQFGYNPQESWAIALLTVIANEHGIKVWADGDVPEACRKEH